MNQMKIEEENPDKIKDILHQGIKSYNYQTFGQYDLKRFAIYMENDDAEIIAGVYGFKLAKHHTLRMEFVWVKESLRQQGLGTALLKRAEEYAMQQQCRVIQAMTLDFQAPQFYEKSGYTLLGTVPKWFCEHDAVFFSKTLPLPA